MSTKVIGRRLLTSKASAAATGSTDSTDLLFGKSVEDSDIVEPMQSSGTK
jgi:hypothetical protein